MNLYPINAGNFKLDGGAMFGAVPKTIWNKTNPADSKNLIDISARCLLIEDGERLILIDAGMGNKQSDKFFSYYSLWGKDTLEGSLKKAGFQQKMLQTSFLLTYILIIVGAQLKEAPLEKVLRKFLKMLFFGPTRVIGTGLLAQIKERALLF